MALEGKIRYLRGATKPRQIERPEDVKGGTVGGLGEVRCGPTYWLPLESQEPDYEGD